jgi:hypothetical protein
VVETAFERGWSELKNGELLSAAEAAGFDVLLTTDTNLKYQQNLNARQIALVVLTTTSWPRIQLATELVLRALEQAAESRYVEVVIP